MSPKEVTIRTVEKLVETMKKVDLDGIAVTEHNSRAIGYCVKQIVEMHFNSEVMIIPGRELGHVPIHWVELELPGNDILTFRFLAHPGYPGNPINHIHGFHGIEIQNALHDWHNDREKVKTDWHIDQEKIKGIAAKYNLVLLSNSDAHYLHDLGQCYNEISLEDLRHHCHPLNLSPPLLE